MNNKSPFSLKIKNILLIMFLLFGCIFSASIKQDRIIDPLKEILPERLSLKIDNNIIIVSPKEYKSVEILINTSDRSNKVNIK